jgi:hypothetical protein
VSGRAVGPDGPTRRICGIRLVVPGDGVVSESEFDVATAHHQARRNVRVLRRAAGAVSAQGAKAAATRTSCGSARSESRCRGDVRSGRRAAGTEGQHVRRRADLRGRRRHGRRRASVVSGFRVSGRLEFESATGRPSAAGRTDPVR